MRNVEDVVRVDSMTVSHGNVRATHALNFSVGPGEVVTLLGPSGCGKTTTLRAVAGLEEPDEGRITIGGRIVFDSQGGVNVPPERRGLSMVFQSYAIWPHMTVFENVAFGLRARRNGSTDVAGEVRRNLELVGLGSLADRPATKLSGGQQQRVALARAITGNPGVILLDEPLSNLDAQLRVAMRTEFRELQRALGLAAIYVTHDQEEALVLSDRVLVMREGTIEQAGTPADVHDAPRTRFVAEFVGVRNVLECAVEGEAIAVLPGGIRLQARGAASSVPACICFRPASVQLATQSSDGAYPAVLRAVTYLGDLVQYELQAGAIKIWARGMPREDLAAGAAVYWSVPRQACFFAEA